MKKLHRNGSSSTTSTSHRICKRSISLTKTLLRRRKQLRHNSNLTWPNSTTSQPKKCRVLVWLETRDTRLCKMGLRRWHSGSDPQQPFTFISAVIQDLTSLRRQSLTPCKCTIPTTISTSTTSLSASSRTFYLLRLKRNFRLWKISLRQPKTVDSYSQLTSKPGLNLKP